MTTDRPPRRDARAAHDVAICLFAKPPRPGLAKTRLVPPLTPGDAAMLARAFVADSWSAIAELPWARAILATTEHDDAFAVDPARVWLQGAGDLGARIERVLSRALREHRAAIAIGADSPGLPAPALATARDALVEHDVVIGPALDGGFYLLGLRSCPPGILGNITWSAPTTFAETHLALTQRGLRTHVLPPWFDVDEHADLEILRALLETGLVCARQTTAALSALRVPRAQEQDVVLEVDVLHELGLERT